jgi:hypothetical protein
MDSAMTGNKIRASRRGDTGHSKSTTVTTTRLDRRATREGS